MLQTAAIKVSLREPRSKFLDMIRLLKSFGTERVHLVHAFSGKETLLGEKEQQMETLAGEVRQLGFQVSTLLGRGSISLQTIAASRELAVDYIGLYWLPKPVLVQALLGSADADILRLSDIPVFVYNRRLMSASSKIQRVLYATCFQATDSRVMPYLKNKNFQAEELILLHVGERAPDPAAEHLRQKRVQNNLNRLAEECRSLYTTVNTLQVIGHERKQILRQANLYKVDLIVVGKADKPKPFKNVLGSTAEVLPDKSNRSVFIVPGYC
jgi:nucleotide-binding universal stress UspA family protein